MIIAKSKETAKNVTELFRENKIKKTYWALVEGTPKKKIGHIEASIAKIKVNKIEKMEVIEKRMMARSKVDQLSKDLMVKISQV